jgi:hypothetical protein
MAVVHKILTGTLTTTLTTVILTAPAVTRIEIQVLRFTVSSAGGSITSSVLDTSTTVVGHLLQAHAIDKDNPIELNGIRLEADDVLRGGFGNAAAGAEYYIAYTEHT